MQMEKNESSEKILTSEHVEKGLENSEVEKLLQLLKEINKLSEMQMISALLNQMNEMEKGYRTTLEEIKQELQNTKEQLSSMEGNIHSDKQSDIIEPLVNTERMIKEGQQKLQNMNKTLEKKAAEVIKNFKSFGVSALNNVCKFLGVKENLVKLRDISRSNAEMQQNSLEKIANIESELARTSLHMKNVFRAIRGNDLLNPQETNQSFKLFEKIKVPYQRRLDKFNSRTEMLNNSIKKIETLEHSAQNVVGEKQSVVSKLEKNKEKIATEEKNNQNMQPQKEKGHEPAL